MSLTNEQKKHFRTIAHALKPVVTVAGNGLSEAVIKEIDRALNDHELIKVKLAIADRESRNEAITMIGQELKAEVIQQIGKVVVLLREARKPNSRLSNLRR